jgi:Sulfotransferase family
MSRSELEVIFIGGSPRSGSTLLALLLNSLPGHFAAGEMRYLWLRGLQGNQLCECGQPFRSCPLWREVVSTALGPIDELRAEHYTDLWKRAAGPLAVWRSLFPRSTDMVRQQHEYLDALRRVVLALGRISGGRFVVDSSKYATDCLLLSRLPGIRVHAIHLVRDSRAVAYSWRRTKRRPEIHWQQLDMELMSPIRSSYKWGSLNAAMEFVGTRVDRYDRIRYEDLVCDPFATLSPVLPSDLRTDLAEVLSGDRVRPGAGHTFSGNPLRFERAPLTIRPDVEWITKMDESDRLLVTGLTLPLLMRYGYPVRPRRASSRARSSVHTA